MIARPALASLLLLSGAMLLGDGAARAQVTAPGTATAGRHDGNAPVDFGSDRIEVQDRDHKATLIGNVRATQADMTLTADRVVALYTGSYTASAGGGSGSAGGGPKVQRMDASGHVVVTRPGEIGRGNYGIYDLQTKLVTLVGNVSLDRNGSIVHGGRLVIDQNTNRATVDGAAVGGAGSAGKGGRVSGRFLVDQKASPAPAPTPALRPAGTTP